jgi:hypothetical protein
VHNIAYYRDPIGKKKKRALNGKRAKLKSDGDRSAALPALARERFCPGNRLMLEYVRMLVSLIEARSVSRTEVVQMPTLLAVNLGNDADTTGAIYGQLAGAFYGAEQIPPEWRTKLAMHDFVVEMADQLVSISGAVSSNNNNSSSRASSR